MPIKMTVFVSLVVIAATCFGAELQEVRTVDLYPEIREERPLIGPAQHTAFALAFSPNGRYLALALGIHHSERGPVTHVIVLATANYKRSFESDVAVSFISKLEWSSDGHYLLAQSTVGSWILDPSGSGKSCDIGDTSHDYLGFVSGEMFAVARNTVSRTTVVRFFDTNCARVGEVVTPFSLNYGDASDEAGLIAASNPGEGVEIFRVSPWKKLSTVIDKRTGLRVIFFNAGSGFCAGTKIADGDATMRCWRLGPEGPVPGKAFAAKNASALPVSSARDASLIAIQFSSLTYNRFTEGGSARFKGWTLWDPVRDEIRGTLSPRTQLYRYLPEQKHANTIPYAAALSPTGEFFAVAGDQTLEVFSVPPSPN